MPIRSKKRTERKLKDSRRWNAMLSFIDRTFDRAPKNLDGRIGLLMAECWNLGYDSGLKRGLNSKR